jgi:hypothetical protein
MSKKSKILLWSATATLVLSGLSYEAYTHDYKRVSFFVLALPAALVANVYVADDYDRAVGIFNAPIRIAEIPPEPDEEYLSKMRRPSGGGGGD